MAPPYGDICRKVEDAIAAIVRSYTDANLDGVQVVTGAQGAAETHVPRVVVVSSGADPELLGDDETIFLGNWFVDAEIAVVTSYVDDTRKERELRAAELFDIILQPEFPELMNNEADVTDFHAYGKDGNQTELGLVPGSITRAADEKHFVETMAIRQYCRPST